MWNVMDTFATTTVVDALKFLPIQKIRKKSWIRQFTHKILAHFQRVLFCQCSIYVFQTVFEYIVVGFAHRVDQQLTIHIQLQD